MNLYCHKLHARPWPCYNGYSFTSDAEWSPMRKIIAVLALAVFALLVPATAQAAPFDCPWTAESNANPSSSGDYGGGP